MRQKHKLLKLVLSQIVLDVVFKFKPPPPPPRHTHTTCVVCPFTNMNVFLDAVNKFVICSVFTFVICSECNPNIDVDEVFQAKP
jgi:hypothetical protein